MVLANYFFEGQSRFSVYDLTPNETALLLMQVVLLLVVPLCSALYYRRWLLAGGVSLFVVSLVFLLARTFSRGAFIGFSAATAFFLIKAIVLYVSRERNRHLFVCTTIAIVLLLSFICSVWGTGAYRRANLPSLQTDPSVATRLSVWKQTIPYLYQFAFARGAGKDTAGVIFSNWLSPLEFKASLTKTTCTFFDLILERGFAGTLAIVISSTALVLVSIASIRSHRFTGLDAALHVSLAVGLSSIVAACFSSFSFFPYFVAPTGALVGIFMMLFVEKKISWLGSTIGLFAVALIYTAILIGASFAIRSGPRITRLGDGLLRLKNTTTSNYSIRIVLDEHTLGLSPGRRLRRWIQESQDARDFIVDEIPERVSTQGRGFESRETFLFGKAAELGGTKFDQGKVTLILPRGRPSDSRVPQNAHVILSEINEEGTDDAWIAWATKYGFEYVIRRDCGIFLREDDMPAVLK